MVNEGIKNTQSAIIGIISQLQERDLQLAQALTECHEHTETLTSILPSKIAPLDAL